MAAATIISSVKVGHEYDDVQTLSERLETIQTALRAYYAKRGYYPCPAARTDLPSTASFGQSTDCTTAAPAGTTDVTPAGGAATDAIRIGVLPTRALSLPDRYMFDPWGNRLTYTIIKQLGVDSSTYSGFTTSLTTGVIRINDSSGTQRTTNSVTVHTVYVVISHGPNAKGAYNKRGLQPVACGATELDAENCDNDEIFVDTVVNETAGATYYNDFIRWSTW